jgi:hypothetical protein
MILFYTHYSKYNLPPSYDILKGWFFVKKIFVLLMIIVMMFSFAACGETVTNSEGVEIEKNIEAKVELIVVERHLAEDKYGCGYYMYLENDDYAIFFNAANPKTFFSYFEDDVMKGTLELYYDKMDGWYKGIFKHDGYDFNVIYCEVK